jgi:tartrate dehydrogenase/decarboxylase/D-malate dehydrogenase
MADHKARRSSFSVAVIPGDGVGPEVTRAAVRIGERAAAAEGVRTDWHCFDWGCAYFLKTGRMMPADGLDRLSAFDAVFLGCIGDTARVPDPVSLELLLAIRKGFDQYVNLRPIYLYPGVDCPLKNARPGSIDMVVVRENVEGEYARLGGRFKQGSEDEVALQTSVFTRKGIERVMRYAFELARRRGKPAASGGGKSGQVTNCSKSNALNYSLVLWDEVYDRVAGDYPDVATDFALVDALTMWLVKNPDRYDVIVASNLFGDIITDLGAMLQGGMGFAAGGNINPEKCFPSMFEPIHGSAPKYAGLDVVNPIAAIEAVRLLFEHLGLSGAAERLGGAVRRVLADGRVRTRDMGGTDGTQAMAEAVLAAAEEDRGGPQ